MKVPLGERHFQSLRSLAAFEIVFWVYLIPLFLVAGGRLRVKRCSLLKKPGDDQRFQLAPCAEGRRPAVRGAENIYTGRSRGRI